MELSIQHYVMFSQHRRRDYIMMKRFDNDNAKSHAKDDGALKDQDVTILGRKLQTYYDTVANEPIPDHFLDLLEKLDKSEEKIKQINEQDSNDS